LLPSTSGLGHHPFTVATPVRIRLGVPYKNTFSSHIVEGSKDSTPPLRKVLSVFLYSYRRVVLVAGHFKYTIMHTEKNLAILIDCWNSPDQLFPSNCDYKLYRNIIKFVDSNPTIDAVCLSSYNIEKKEYFSDNHWYQDIVNKEYEFSRLMEYNKLVPIDEYITNKKLLKWKSKKKQFVAHFLDQIADNYDNVYLCGKAFEICVVRRPVGLYNLINDKKAKVYVKQDCVLTANGKFPNLDQEIHWKHVKDDIYRCIGLDETNKPWEYNVP